MDAKGVIGNICGFLTVVGGIFLLNAFRDMPISWRDVSSATKKSASVTGSVERLNADQNETHQLLDNEERDFTHSNRVMISP